MNAEQELNWCAINDLHSGLGRMAYQLAKRVKYPLRWVPTRTSSDFTPPQEEFWEFTRRGSRSIVIDGISELDRCVQPGDLVYTMWETTRLPAVVVAAINRSRCCIVPSQWCAETFAESGVRVPLRKVPLGIDPQVFNTSLRKRPQGGRFKFGSCCRFCCDGNPRKNLPVIIEAFKRAFPRGTEPVDLVFKGYDTGVPRFDDPRITLTNDFWDDDVRLAEWYSTLDSIVNVASAGGWELHLHEAMATGAVPISVAYSGEREFFSDAVGFVVKHSVVKPGWNVYSIGEWCMPDAASLAEQLKAVVECAGSPRFSELSGAAAKVAAALTWDNSAVELEKVIDEFLAT